MYMHTDILAVIVSYNPTEILIQNMNSLIPQVAKVIILDNNSSEVSREIIRSSQLNNCVEVYFYEENKGVAFRLNQALSMAFHQGFPLLLTMDQDTVLFNDSVEQMLKVLNKNSEIDAVGPNRSQIFDSSISVDYTVANYLITSGNLVKVDKALSCGGYADELFIDLVDVEFSLALRARGSLLANANRARMYHEVGECATGQFMFWRYHYQTHSPQRFYYISRNRVIVFEKYKRIFPMYIAKCRVVAFFLSLQQSFFNRNEPLKVSESKRGRHDGHLYVRKHLMH